MKKYILVLVATVAFSVGALAQIPTAGLVAYYPFNGNANDLSGHNYHGIVFGATLTMDRFSNANSAYNFDGQNDYIDLSSHVNSLNFLSPATISFWVNTKYDTPQTTFSITDGANALYGAIIYIGNNSTGTLYNELITAWQESTTSDYYITGFETTNRNLLINTGWHNIVVTYDNVYTDIYLDNTLLGSNCNWGTNNGEYGNFSVAVKAMLGARYSSGIGAYLNGYLDDVRIYNQVLTPAQITSLYNETPATSVENNSFEEHFNIYPNPAKESLSINTSFNYKTIEIYNVLGESIYKDESDFFNSDFEININNITKGIYFLKLTDGEKTLIERFVKE